MTTLIRVRHEAIPEDEPVYLNPDHIIAIQSKNVDGVHTLLLNVADETEMTTVTDPRSIDLILAHVNLVEALPTIFD